MYERLNALLARAEAMVVTPDGPSIVAVSALIDELRRELDRALASLDKPTRTRIVGLLGI